MRTRFCIQIVISLLSFRFKLVEGFAQLSTRQSQFAFIASSHTGNIIIHDGCSFDRSSGIIFASKNGDDNNDAEIADEYDFEAGFQERLQKEGGRRGLQAKAAKRSVDSATKVVTSGLKQSKQSVDLLSVSEWNLTVGFLVLVVVLAVGTHLASPVPFENSTNGEQLGFGVR